MFSHGPDGFRLKGWLRYNQDIVLVVLVFLAMSCVQIWLGWAFFTAWRDKNLLDMLGWGFVITWLSAGSQVRTKK